MSELSDDFENLIRRVVRDEIASVLREIQGNPLSLTSMTKEAGDMRRPLLNAREVSEILGVTVQRVYELTRSRKTNGFPVVLLGERQYRFQKEAPLRWMERGNDYAPANITLIKVKA